MAEVKFTREDTKVIKGLAIVLMLYHHLFRFPDRISEAIDYQPLFFVEETSSAYLMGGFGKLCVALFLFLSGYGLYSSCRNKEHITTVLKDKVVNLYTRYWLVFAVFISICALCGVDKKITAYSFFENFSGLKISFNGEWWFFTPYVLLLMTYPLGRKFYNRKNATPLGDIFLLTVLSLLVYKVLPDIMELSFMETFAASFGGAKFKELMQQLPTFMMGGVFAKYDILSYCKKIYGKNRINGILAIGAIIALFWCRTFLGIELDCITAPAFIIASILALQTFPLGALYRGFERVGKESTFIWLTHSFFCYDLCQEFIYMPKYTILIFLLLLVVSMITSVILRRVYECLEKGCKIVYRKANF